MPDPAPTLRSAATGRPGVSTGPGDPRPARPEPAAAGVVYIRWDIVGWSILVAILMAGAASVGFLFGLRADTPEHTRTRRAVCQVLDQLGADPSTAAQVQPCADTPARP